MDILSMGGKPDDGLIASSVLVRICRGYALKQSKHMLQWPPVLHIVMMSVRSIAFRSARWLFHMRLYIITITQLNGTLDMTSFCEFAMMKHAVKQRSALHSGLRVSAAQDPEISYERKPFVASWCHVVASWLTGL